MLNNGTKNYMEELQKVIDSQFNIYNIDPCFPMEIAGLQEKDIQLTTCDKRKDFRGELALTIDCKDCKDMDDAVSVVRTKCGYRLAVHIADVASYVPMGSALDQIAVNRATSIYLPQLTVPMLPTVLSNGSCSLNPGVPRMTLSVIVHLNNDGSVINSEITKGLICSRVKGVYSEINSLLSGDKTYYSKYSEVYMEMLDMVSLYKILRRIRIRRGAKIEDTDKPKIIVDDNDISLVPVKKGIAENMIEEFMILANRIVAEYLYDNNLPAIFRVQEIRNHLASYHPEKMHHSDLALESYSHFTSPIRRIADLKIHQILTMHLDGLSNQMIHELFDEHLVEVCDLATRRGRTAKQIETKCARYCYEQYFQIHRNASYIGTLVGYDRRKRPLLQIADYNIRVVGYGYSVCHGRKGDHFSFYVGYSDENNELYTKNTLKVA